jgi:polyisoprenoid-binding protein YceI
MLRLFTCAIMATAIAASAQPVETKFVPAPGAHFTLTVEKTGLWSGRKHVFEFERYAARVTRDHSVEFEVDAASATCKDAWVSEKDRVKVLAYMLHDMLDVEHHPKLVFRSERVVEKGGGVFEIAGQLSVRGIEKPVVVTVTAAPNLSTVSGSAMVKIKDYGLTPPKAALGAIGTKNEMTVNFRLVAAPPTR